MEPFFSTLLAVFLAEIGDKTQLLTLFLAAKFRNKWAVIGGIVTATTINHLASAYIGVLAGSLMSDQVVAWVAGVSFIVVGMWLLVPDNADENQSRWLTLGAFAATTILFFIAEIGDKTQIATTLLAARFESVWIVASASVLGLLLANVPVIYFGEALMRRVPQRIVRIAACSLFCTIGILSIATHL
ncbi:UPF0016 family membrane protein [Campylobacterota bacterium]|nr:UPF0016 family membrane protein [Campylobacterota bacterium]